MKAGFPCIKLRVGPGGRGTFSVNGIELPVSHVAIEAIAQRGTWVRFEMLANVECEVSPEGSVAIKLREEGGE